MVNYRPDGYSSITPMLVVTNAAAAISFYETVFGARQVSRMDGPGDTVLHAELELEVGRFQVMDANDTYHTAALDPGDDKVPYSVAIYVADCDAVTATAEELGATVRETPADFDVTGDRFSSIRDPFGVRWTVMTRVTDKTDAEIQAGVDDWLQSMEAAGEP